MKTRIITAIVALGIFLPVLIFSNTVLFPIFIALCSVIAVYELMNCIQLRSAWVLSVPLYLIAAGLPFLIRYVTDHNLVRRAALVACLVVSLYFLAVLTFSHGKFKLADVSICFLTVFYVLAGFNSILVLRDFQTGGEFVYLAVFLGAWVTDTFAYFCGMLFGRGGKHKLLPDVSPKKTVEGSIGGTVFAVIAMVAYGAIINHNTELSASAYWIFALAGLISAVVAQIGDLSMSLIKRTYGIKDYGKIFPGHGGVLDRFDSIIAVAIALATFCSFLHFF
ncbi:MAG: phosphatidate cytidylyltransferase [Clostridia bacterium]|nr:phosphatidate cytidylyltransferase [Clostridia bacterium]